MSPPPPNLRNIYIVGAQCTGKTTLVHALERFFASDAGNTPPRIVTELARDVLREINFKTADIRDSPTLSFELQKLILQRQYEAEIIPDGEWLISDRSAADPIMYTKHLCGEDAVQALLNTPEWGILAERMRASAVIVCEAGTVWLKDDGVRLMPESRSDWMDLHEKFCRFLAEMRIRYTIVPNSMTDIDDRVKHVVDFWKLGLI